MIARGAFLMKKGEKILEIINSGDKLTVLLSGELDHHSFKKIRPTIDAQIEEHTPKLIILDFGGVNFMDSSGIGLILGRKRIAESFGGRVMLQNITGYVEKLINLAGLSTMIIKKKIHN